MKNTIILLLAFFVVNQLQAQTPLTGTKLVFNQNRGK